MPINPEYLQNFEPKKAYHIYNRTNNGETLFIDDNERFFFLNRLKQFLDGYFSIHAYCLLGNHFHILATTKSRHEVRIHLKNKYDFELCKTESRFSEEPTNARIFQDLLSNQFSRLFTSYAILVNKNRKRNGNLFHRPFKRILIPNDFYFKQLVIYIHKNPVKHGLTSEYRKYEWSSYSEYEFSGDSFLERQKVLNVFNGKSRFINAHRKFTKYEDLLKFYLEDKVQR